MRIPSVLAETDDRSRFMDLSMSLYESLGDLLTDLDRLSYDETTPNDFDAISHRLSISAMNCMGDLELLLPVFTELMRMRFPDKRVALRESIEPVDPLV